MAVTWGERLFLEHTDSHLGLSVAGAQETQARGHVS